MGEVAGGDVLSVNILLLLLLCPVPNLHYLPVNLQQGLLGIARPEKKNMIGGRVEVKTEGYSTFTPTPSPPHILNLERYPLDFV